MVSLRRQKLKAKRAGCDPEKVDKCLNHDEVMKLMDSKTKQITLQPGETKKIEVEL